jgi:plastocyanin
MKNMKKWIASMLCVMTFLLMSEPARSAPGTGHDDGRLVATMMFGAGMNTPSTTPANQHVLPQTVHIKPGGVVNFVVSGFHQIVIYNPGVVVEAIIPPASGTWVNNLTNVYYTGIVPADGPPQLPETINPSNAANRVEAVSFSQPGTYLVICNVRTHFINGMYAYVVVGDDDHDADHDGHRHEGSGHH